MKKHTIHTLIELAATFVLVFGACTWAMTTRLANAAETTKNPLHISMNYAKTLGKGHTTPGACGQIDKSIEDMWKNLPITVVDENGKEHEVTKELNKQCERTFGEFVNGEKVTIKVDMSGLPEGYCLSWESDYTYPKPTKNYAQFQVVVDSSQPVRISFAKMNVKFDLQGGTLNNSSDSIIKSVKKDNTVDFPANPTKKDLEFGGWFTELPDTESYRKRGTVGKRYYWDSQSPFSDYSRDWMSWNDTKLDPLYDGVFLLRAQWNARETFDANGGSFSNGRSSLSAPKRQNTKIKIIGAPQRSGYEFLNWKDASGNTYNPGEIYTLAKNTVFTAQWKQSSSGGTLPVIPVNTVAFMDGSKVYATVNVESGNSIDNNIFVGQSMPANPTRNGFTFKGWNTQPDGTGVAFTGSTIVKNDMKVYAIYAQDSVATKQDAAPTKTPDQPDLSAAKEKPAQLEPVQVEPAQLERTLPQTGELVPYVLPFVAAGFVAAGLGAFCGALGKKKPAHK